jgi:hypothetical protein
MKPLKRAYRRRPVQEWFDLKVDKIMSSGCWMWVGYTDAHGYGVFRGGRAHRVSYELANGPLATGTLLHHTCENKSCVNPAHLEPVTPAQHTEKHVRIYNTVECPRGHPYTPENRRYRIHNGIKDGSECKLCARDRRKERR